MLLAYSGTDLGAALYLQYCFRIRNKGTPISDRKLLPLIRHIAVLQFLQLFALFQVSDLVLFLGLVYQLA
jgi:hypothetical protein